MLKLSRLTTKCGKSKKKYYSHVKSNFIFGVRCSKLSIVSEERDFKGLVKGLMKMLVQESTTVNRKKWDVYELLQKNKEQD